MQVNLNSQGLQEYNRIMDVLTVKHKTIAQNVANINSPGYIRKTVDFETELVKALNPPADDNLRAVDGNRAGWPAEIKIVEDRTHSARTDGNNVSMEKEMVDLAQVTQLYSMLARLTSKNIKMTQYVISGGR